MMWFHLSRLRKKSWLTLNTSLDECVLKVEKRDRSLEDKEILKRVMDGHTDAYGQIFTRHRGRAYALAYQYLRNHEEAKDVVQDAFIRAYQKLKSFDLSRNFGPWLLTIVRNLSIDYLRKRKRVSEDGLPPVLPDQSGSRADDHLLKWEVWQVLKSLKESQREIIFLKDYQGHSYAEIAEILQIPLGTVMSRLHHARRSLVAGLRSRKR